MVAFVKKGFLSLLLVAIFGVFAIPAGAMAADTAVIVDGTDVTDKFTQEALETLDFSDLDLTDTEVFENGDADAYLVTIGDKTQLVGDTTLKHWVGNWETWQKYIYPDEQTLARYPYLEEVWDIAYDAYIAAFYAVSEEMGKMVEEQYPDTAALKAYWYEMTGTEGVATITVAEAENSGYLLSWLDNDGKVLASDSYTMTGKMVKGLEGATMYVFTADTLGADSVYKYLVTMVPDMEGDTKTPIAAHYHFQFGNSLEDLLVNGETYNGTDTNIKNRTWYATMTNRDASDLAKYNVILGMHQAEKWTEVGESCPSHSFSDLNPGAWYHSATDYVINNKLMEGYPDQTFRPDTQLSRAMLVQVLYNQEGAPEVSGADSYHDTEDGAWYGDAVLWATDHEIVNGYGEGLFGPDDNITREQTAAILYRYAEYKGYDVSAAGDLSQFSDADTISPYAIVPLQWAVAEEVIEGMDDGAIAPKAHTTRAQVATILMRYGENIAQ